MSYLAEVLSTAETIQLKEINTKVPELTNTLEALKEELNNYVENAYVTFSYRPKQQQTMLSKALKLQTEITTLKDNLEELTNKGLVESEQKLQENLHKLVKINLASELIIKLTEYNDNLIKYKCLLKNKSYLECMDLLHDNLELYKYFYGLSSDKTEGFLNNFKDMETEPEALLSVCKQVFEDNLQIFAQNDKKTWKIRNYNEEMEQVMLTFYKYQSFDVLLNFRNCFLEIFSVIVDFTCEVSLEQEDGFNVLTVVKQNEQKNNYKNIFNNLKVVVAFVKDHFNYVVKDGVTLIEYFGREIGDDLLELTKNNCLEKTIPSNHEGLEAYKIVIKDTKEFEEVLQNSGLISKEKTTLFDYVNNIDSLFIEKQCKNYLDLAEKLMKKDLHDMMETGSPYDPKHPFSEASFVLPQCYISKSTLQLSTLLETIFKQSQQHKELLITIQQIIRKYCEMVPIYHQQLLQTIPQQVALFHNNCNALTYKINEIFQNSSEERLFPAEIYELKATGEKAFETFTSEQIKLIKETMSQAELNVQTLKNLKPITEKSVRQCLRQQELLKTVWQKVLPYHTYNKTIGLTLTALCTVFIDCCVRYEDISTEGAEHLGDVLKVILTRGPKLFTDPNEINLFVPCWYKLNEVNFVLKSSLAGISQRWADGKGPLGMHFEPSELKQMIRALFQNTDRRAAVLAGIN